jgi:mannose-6-phosphate isomerase-like protein (cupin superfamily)
MPVPLPWLLPGPFPAELPTEERCRIPELLNDPACPDVSLALARVAPGVTTRLHALLGIAERYVIRRGEGVVRVGGVEHRVGEGDRVLIPPGAPQRITNAGTTELEFYCVCTPRFRPESYRDLEQA